MQSRSFTEGRAIGWIAAALAAGPVYAMIVLGSALVRANAQMPVGLVFILPLAVCLGLVLAAAPIGMMIVIGGWLGARWAIWRRPVIWWAVGGVGGTLAGPLLDVTRLGNLAAGAIAGALVAAIARRYVRWRDPVVLQG
ncbi:hypothetical protein [uncultured Sphingomonas sp.]|jgi:hypothetical protein|uniref:hypothetical protein n=1 Tax=unclassified Sphingomonas TaxID=196159 RepID=UPI0025F56041|nr:hypothetical protein [uncultured Sphingomonas sp.]